MLSVLEAFGKIYHYLELGLTYKIKQCHFLYKDVKNNQIVFSKITLGKNSDFWNSKYQPKVGSQSILLLKAFFSGVENIHIYIFLKKKSKNLLTCPGKTSNKQTKKTLPNKIYQKVVDALFKPVYMHMYTYTDIYLHKCSLTGEK